MPAYRAARRNANFASAARTGAGGGSAMAGHRARSTASGGRSGRASRAELIVAAP